MVAVPQTIRTQSELVQSLAAEAASFHDFVLLLQSEQDALVQGEVDKLIELARRKSEQIFQLSQLAEARNHYLSGQGCSDMEQWLKRLDSNEAATPAATWKQLLNEAREAQHLNQTNGVMIETRLQHNQKALAVLQAAANQTSVYGPDGQPQGSGMGRPLGKV